MRFKKYTMIQQTNFKLVLPLVIVMTIFAACNKSVHVGSDSPTKGIITGTIQTLDDKFNNTNDKEGIKITLTNYQNTSVTTDANGKFTFENIPFDSYDLEISKAGYGTYKIFGLKHELKDNGTTISTIVPSLQYSKISTTVISSAAYTGNTINNEPGVSFTVGFTPAASIANKCYARYFLSTSPNVSNSNYMAYSTVRYFLNNSSTAGLTSAELNLMGFTSGQTVYIKIYGESALANDYFNPNTGFRVFPNLNSTTVNAISFVMP